VSIGLPATLNLPTTQEAQHGCSFALVKLDISPNITKF
jgi:hypothetical protein